MYVWCNNVVRAPNNYCLGNATMSSLCILGLYIITVNKSSCTVSNIFLLF